MLESLRDKASVLKLGLFAWVCLLRQEDHRSDMGHDRVLFWDAIVERGRLVDMMDQDLALVGAHRLDVQQAFEDARSTAQTAAEEEAIRRCVRRGQPWGSAAFGQHPCSRLRCRPLARLGVRVHPPA